MTEYTSFASVALICLVYAVGLIAFWFSDDEDKWKF